MQVAVVESDLLARLDTALVDRGNQIHDVSLACGNFQNLLPDPPIMIGGCGFWTGLGKQYAFSIVVMTA